MERLSFLRVGPGSICPCIPRVYARASTDLHLLNKSRHNCSQPCVINETQVKPPEHEDESEKSEPCVKHSVGDTESLFAVAAAGPLFNSSLGVFSQMFKEMPFCCG